MNPIAFSATLESRENGICEEGQAYLARDDSVTFTSDFVPLIKLGTRVAITRTLGEKRFERFVGKVYLSSRKLLRIVDVDDDIISEAMKKFDSNAIFPSEFYITSTSNAKRVNTQKCESVSGFVRYITPDAVKICTMEYTAEDKFLMFSLADPALTVDKMVVKVEERILLMRSAAVLLCRPVLITPMNENAIIDYLRQLEFQRNLEV